MPSRPGSPPVSWRGRRKEARSWRRSLARRAGWVSNGSPAGRKRSGGRRRLSPRGSRSSSLLPQALAGGGGGGGFGKKISGRSAVRLAEPGARCREEEAEAASGRRYPAGRRGHPKPRAGSWPARRDPRKRPRCTGPGRLGTAKERKRRAAKGPGIDQLASGKHDFSPVC